MKKFYVISQFTRDEENSIEVLVRKSHIAECPGDEWSTLVVFDYKDAAKLKRYLTEAGKIIPRRVTGNCAEHQRMVAKAIKRAREAAIISYVFD